MNRIQCFLIEKTDIATEVVAHFDRNGPCASGGTKHSAHISLNKDFSKEHVRELSIRGVAKLLIENGIQLPQCACGLQFELSDAHGNGSKSAYLRVDNGDRVYKDAPGAMWYGWNYGWAEGSKEDALWVQTPGGAWCIDSRASNCTRPYDNAHRCWVRHGEAPNITVDKNGNTCQAGAGSIICGDYHGFLRNGFLE